MYNLQSNALGWYTKQFLFNFQLNHVSWAPTLSFLTCAPIYVSCRPIIITQMSHCSKMCQGYPASESPTEWAGKKLLFSLFCFISPDLFLGTFVICCPCSCLSAAYFITHTNDKTVLQKQLSFFAKTEPDLSIDIPWLVKKVLGKFLWWNNPGWWWWMCEDWRRDISETDCLMLSLVG